ncbi:MAG: HAD-IIA family hydrolase [Candidatus Binatia bacterium]
MPANYIIDMDGVIYLGNELIPGVQQFIERLVKGNHRFLFLTNSSNLTPSEIQRKLSKMGIEVSVNHFFTSAMATADFLHHQHPRGRVYIIGGEGLREALTNIGYTITEEDPDYVVVGTTRTYDYDHMAKAVELVRAGARLIGTNPDVTGPSDHGIIPACGALVAPIQLVTGAHPYFVGKPNPLMMRTALRRIHAHSDDTFMVGDRMDTDVVAGTEAGMRTILVLSGVTSRAEIDTYAFRPHYVFAAAGDIPVAELG